MEQEVINLPVGKLPQNWVPVEIVCIVRCMDEKGEEQLAVRQSGGVHGWDAVGMLRVAEQAVTMELLSGFQPGEEY